MKPNPRSRNGAPGGVWSIETLRWMLGLAFAAGAFVATTRGSIRELGVGLRAVHEEVQKATVHLVSIDSVLTVAPKRYETTEGIDTLLAIANRTHAGFLRADSLMDRRLAVLESLQVASIRKLQKIPRP